VVEKNKLNKTEKPILKFRSLHRAQKRYSSLMRLKNINIAVLKKKSNSEKEMNFGWKGRKWEKNCF
jgi:hypothetical protein